MRDSEYLRTDEPATAEYVLAVLRDVHRQQCEYDPEADPDADLTFESTVAEWRDACDLIDWRRLGRAYNHWWEINCSDAEWKRVLKPASKKRLAGVCELIARHTTRPRICPAGFLGASCAPAGAFLVIRSLLRQAGVNADTIAPSTPLAAYTSRHGKVFLGPILRLAPGALPVVRVRIPLFDDVPCYLGIVGGLCMLGGMLAGWPVPTIGGCLLYISAWLAAWIGARWGPPATCEFPGLSTFRDLARVIAEGNIA